VAVTGVATSTIRFWLARDGRWEAELPDGRAITTMTRRGLLCLAAQMCSGLVVTYRFEPTREAWTTEAVRTRTRQADAAVGHEATSRV